MIGPVAPSSAVSAALVFVSAKTKLIWLKVMPRRPTSARSGRSSRHTPIDPSRIRRMTRSTMPPMPQRKTGKASGAISLRPNFTIEWLSPQSVTAVRSNRSAEAGALSGWAMSRGCAVAIDQRVMASVPWVWRVFVPK